MAFWPITKTCTIDGKGTKRPRRRFKGTRSENFMERNVVIIGSGPAGYTAAIYAARANLKPLVLAGYAAGGQLITTTEVENFPGFPEGVMGPDLMENMRKQAERFGAEILYKDVTKVDFSKRPFEVTYEDTTVKANAVIIST